MSSLLLRRSAATLTAARSASTHQLKRCARASRFVRSRSSMSTIEAISPQHTSLPTHRPRHFSSPATTTDYNDNDDLLLFPTKHSSKLPPAICPPSLLRSEVESLFDVPIGSLIPYHPPSNKQLRSVSEEVEYAYYQSDAVVQRVEYVMRGLNAVISEESFVSRSVDRGYMTVNRDEQSGSSGLTRQECFRAMMDLLERMGEEGEAFVELRTRVRSQLVGGTDQNGSSSDSSSSSSSDSDDDEVDEAAVKEFTEYTEERMRSAGFATATSSDTTTASTLNDMGEDDLKLNPQDYQFGAAPGVTVHMYDLLLDSLACLCKEQYSPDGPSANHDAVDLIEVMEHQPPPQFAKDILDQVLNTHWMDGGDIGLGSAADAANALNKIAQGVGIGAGTGSGALARYTAMEFDIRTCPTPMTFNSVLRIASEFNHVSHANMVQEALVLSGSITSSKNEEDDERKLKMEQDRLRDITMNAAFSTYAQMAHTSALTLRTIKASTKKATSRQAIKRQAKMLDTGFANKRQVDIISGRNAATYNYLIGTLSKCLPPSITRGNMAFGLYHKACVQEGVMDEGLVKSMMRLGGYDVESMNGSLESSSSSSSSSATPPLVSNGPLFDKFMQEELGNGADVALEKGRRLRHDRNYRMRRFVDWDDTY
ncbi:hypothetical protein ACHAXN_013265 [Cyclotella atomus]